MGSCYKAMAKQCKYIFVMPQLVGIMNEVKIEKQYFLSRAQKAVHGVLFTTTSTPFFKEVSQLESWVDPNQK